MWLRRSCIASAILCLLLLGSETFGQQGAGAPGVDDPELYFAFFTFHQMIQKDISGTEAASDAGRLRAAAARHFDISEEDLARVGALSSTVLSSLSTVAEQGRTYHRGELAAGRRPVLAKLEAFNNRRLALLRQGASDLQRVLSAPGWQAAHAYINGTLRVNMVRKELTHAQ